METTLEKSETTTTNKQNGSRPEDMSPANGSVSFADLLDRYEYPEPQKGEILEGAIIRIKDGVIVVDVGAKRDAIVPYDETSELDPQLLKSLSPGDVIPVYVTRTPRGDQDLTVSLERGLEEEDWVQAEQLLQDETVSELPIVGYNKGGLQVQFGRITGFLPNSRELSLRSIRDRQQRMNSKREMIGGKLPLRIIEIDRRRRRLVLSAIEAQQEQQRSQLEELNEGDVVTGLIASLTDFGAFVDIGKLTGLLHISKIAWGNLDHPQEVLNVGDEVEVRIDSVDVEKGRISLNRRALIPGPWDEFVAEHQEGDLLEGTANSLTSFGIFVEVRPGLEGLLHKSEMRLRDGEDPGAVISTGDRLLVRIVNIDRERERLGLSMTRVSETEEINWMMEQPAVTPGV